MNNFFDEYLELFSENNGKNKITYNGIKHSLTKLKKKKIKKLKIHEYEELCPECLGWGLIDVFEPLFHEKNSYDDYYYHYIYECVICNGRGKIDWLSKIRNPINMKEFVFDIEHKI